MEEKWFLGPHMTQHGDVRYVPACFQLEEIWLTRLLPAFNLYTASTFEVGLEPPHAAISMDLIDLFRTRTSLDLGRSILLEKLEGRYFAGVQIIADLLKHLGRAGELSSLRKEWYRNCCSTCFRRVLFYFAWN